MILRFRIKFRPCFYPRSKIYGGFDWALSRFLHADKEADAKMAPGPYFTGAVPRRVIALSPDIDLSKTRTLRDFKRVIAGLLQVGGTWCEKHTVVRETGRC